MKISHLILTMFLVLVASLAVSASEPHRYPSEWWQEISRDQVPAWEVLPQDAGAGQVVLSKRTELGVFSNLAHTPFVFESVRYASVEGLWQMMKYPDEADATDPRHAIPGWPFKRDEVKGLFMWDSKTAGDEANKLMKENGINWISYGARRFNYKDMSEGSAYHYELIYKAIWQKVQQNDNIKKLLLATGGLELIPDHKQANTSPPSYYYHKILMDIRDKL